MKNKCMQTGAIISAITMVKGGMKGLPLDMGEEE